MAADWQSAYLRAAGLPNTAGNRRLLTSWQRWEGGHTNNSARWNYLNTTQRMPGSRGINSVGVQAYGNLSQGAKAWARTMRNGRYGDLVGAMASGHPYKAGSLVSGLSTWLSGSPTSESGRRYAEKVMGTHVDAPAPSAGTPASRTVSGGVPALRMPDMGKVNFGTFSDIAQGKDPLQALQEMQAAYKQAKVVGGGVNPQTGAVTPIVKGPGRVTALDQKAISYVKSAMGTPYVWGGTKPGGFDCSGLLQWAWGKVGVKIPRTTYDQINAGTAVKKGQLRPGDAVFFGSKGNVHHVGMFVGNGKFIEAPHSGAVVRISKLAGRKDYYGARRYG